MFIKTYDQSLKLNQKHNMSVDSSVHPIFLTLFAFFCKVLFEQVFIGTSELDGIC